MSGDNDIDLMESIEACRTCGVFFLTGSNYLRQIFSSAFEDPDMVLIRIELSTWNVEIGEDDGFPQYICTGCIHEFQKLFKFRRSCVDIQNQWQQFYAVKTQHQNHIHIKTELPDEEKDVCDFVYVDDISDTEYDDAITPFKIPHIPIKEEIIEAAKIPRETPETISDTTNRNVQNEPNEPNNKEQQFIHIDKIEKTELTSSTRDNGTIAEHSSTNMNDSKANNPLENNEVHTSANAISLIQCEYCDSVSANKYEHKLHMKHIHEIKDLECNICGKTFKNSSAARLKFHIKWHKISKHRKCAQCSFFCNTRDALRDHTREMHSKVNCTVCGKLVLPKKMAFHMRNHNADMVFNCTHCTQAFNTLEEQKQHILHNHADESHRSTDIVAESLENQLESEVQNTLISIGVICALCEENFSNQNELQLHVEREHRKVLNNSIENRIPYDSFEVPEGSIQQAFGINSTEGYNDESIAQHIQVTQCAIDKNIASSLNNTYNNDMCNDELMRENHISQIEQYAHADDCSQVAPNLDDAESSEEIDESNNEVVQLRQFQCAQCTDTFDNVEELMDHHELMHSKKAKFTCHICGKVYELKFSLNRHIAKHNSAQV